MDLIQAIVLGIVQGLTEFIPVSSSGHVYLASYFGRWEDPGAGFTAVIQLGTLLAVLIFFREDLANMGRAFVKSLRNKEAREEPDARLAWAVLLGTIPIVLVGLLFEKQIEENLRTPWVISATLIVFGVLLYVSEKMSKAKRDAKSTRIKDGLLIGLWQCLALIPGSSRSGSTITGALFLGFDRESAARFSFLLSVPAIGGSGLYALFKNRSDLMAEGLAPTVVATVVSFVVGYASIAFLMRYLHSRSTLLFSIWRIAVGLITIAVALGWFGRMPSAG